MVVPQITIPNDPAVSLFLLQWDPIFGSSFTAGSRFPLWYANYDGEPNFGDFSPFAGWSSPFRKQFSPSGSKCGGKLSGPGGFLCIG